MSSEGNPGYKRRRSSKHEKLGCLTCRHRRKKCIDKSPPVCSACARLNLKCVWEPVRHVVPATLPENTQTPAFESRPQDEGGAEEDAQRAGHDDELGVKGIKSAQAQAQAPAQAQAITPSIGATLSPITLPDTGLIGTSRRRHIMGYYINVLSRHLTVSEEHNSFLSAFLPMATESTVLMDALFAFSSGHMSLIAPSYKVTALQARSNALNNLATAIRTPSSEVAWHETIAAASLAFLTSEVGLGDSKTWYGHLQGVKDTISSAVTRSRSGEVLRGPDAFKQSSEGQWILRNFAYHDIIGSVTLKKKPLLDGTYLCGITQVVDSYLGVGTDLLRLIAQISRLDQDTQIHEGMATDDIRQRKALFQRSYPPLEKSIEEWRCHPDTAPALAAMAYAYRSATFIHFYRLVRSRIRTDAQTSGQGDTLKASVLDFVQGEVQQHVQRILDHVAAIPVGTCPESTLLFPLFLAGGEAADELTMGLVRERLEQMLESRQFQNVSRALHVLDRLWCLRGPSGSSDSGVVDWTSVLDECTPEGAILLT